jgi:hypothetical protein
VKPGQLVDLKSGSARIVTAWASFWGLLTWWIWVVGLIPFGATVARWWDRLLRPIIRWFGRSILQVKRPILFEPTGSGDGVANWIQTLLVLVVSLIFVALWLAFTRSPERRSLQARLPLIARSCVRYGVGSTLIIYGVEKVFGLQMGVFPWMLDGSVGSKTPMGLLWTFMGVSPGYQALTGAAELLTGILLFAKRTTLLGSLLGAIFMAQVFALNMFFDVPVKLFSFSLLISCMGLAFPDLGRLVSFFLLNRPTQPGLHARVPPDHGTAAATRTRWVGRISKFVVILLFGVALYQPISNSLKFRKQMRPNMVSKEQKMSYRLYRYGVRWIQEQPDNQ